MEFVINNIKFTAEKFNEHSYKVLPYSEDIPETIILEEFKKQLNLFGNYKISSFENIPVFGSVSTRKFGYNIILIN